ncbi:MAG: PD40 domain-containing protein [Candidatus Hydrogenedentes bacterium]|nr:PD40 domain-containing protein [Candidatus Hydrogenedentota bacterium]
MTRRQGFSILTGRLVVVLLVFAVSAGAEEAEAVKVCPCAALAQPPELDGAVAGDPAWADAAEATGFTDMRTGVPSEKQTSFRMGYTPEALYIGLVCDEAQPDEILADLLDGESFRQEDSVEVFLAPAQGPVLQFSVNAIGSRASPRTLKKWAAQAQVGEDSWSIELALPWEVIGKAPAPERAWRINIIRYQPSQRFLERSTWADLEYTPTEVARYGTVAFQGVEPALRDAMLERIRTEVVQENVLLYSRPRRGVFLQAEYGERRVLYNQGREVAPRLSPDGAQILFNSVEGGTAGVWLADRAGTEKTRICDGGQAAWAPDGARFVFVRDGLLVERALGSGEEAVVSPESAPRLAYPSYLPEAGAAAAFRFVCSDEAGTGVYLIGPGAEPAIEQVWQGAIHGQVRCAPDGTALAFQDGAHIGLLDFASRVTRRLTVEPGVQTCPVWADDSGSLCYAGAPSPQAEEWDIRRVALGEPAVVHVVERKVDPGFDWRGSALESAQDCTVRGTSLSLRRGDGPDVWAPGPEGVPSKPLADGVSVANDWLVLRVAPEGVSLAVNGADAAAAALVVADEAGRRATAVADIVLAGFDADGAAVQASFLNGDARVASLTIRLPRTGPFLDIASDNPRAAIGLQAAMDLAIVPDRLANDLVVAAGDLPGAGPALLPQTPLALGCVSEPESLVVMAADARDAAFSVAASADGARLDALSVSGSPRIVVGLLVQDGIWQRLEPVRQDGSWGVDWRPAFQAAWRVAACGGGVADARMWGLETLGRLGGNPVPIATPADDSPPMCVAYALERNPLTPFDIVTPVDMCVDRWGPDAAVGRLDLDGIRRYRCGAGDAPFRELTRYPADWDPGKAIVEPGEFGVLETMGSVFPVDSDGVRSLIRHFGEDALNILRGFDDRVAEYEAAMAGLADTAAPHPELGSMAEDTAAVRAAVGGMPRSDVAGAEKALDAVLANVGTLDELTLEALLALAEIPGNEEWRIRVDRFTSYLAAREGRLWHDGQIRFELWYTEEFTHFANQCRSILAERQAIVQACRDWAKRTCDGAGRIAVAQPDRKPAADEIRARMHTLLRNRLYLEDDWRGEEPLPGGGAP